MSVGLLSSSCAHCLMRAVKTGRWTLWTLSMKRTWWTMPGGSFSWRRPPATPNTPSVNLELVGKTLNPRMCRAGEPRARLPAPSAPWVKGRPVVLCLWHWTFKQMQPSLFAWTVWFGLCMLFESRHSLYVPLLYAMPHFLLFFWCFTPYLKTTRYTGGNEPIGTWVRKSSELQIATWG